VEFAGAAYYHMWHRVVPEKLNMNMKTNNILRSLLLTLPIITATLPVAAVDAPKPDKLTTCPVSGEKLGEMGKPHVFVYKGQEVQLCCKDCKGKFDKDPAPYIRKIEAASKAKK
jgi:YHS domain-containing protein